MHVPDGLLSAPVVATTCLVGAAGLGFGLRRLEKKGDGRTTVLMGSMAAFVFAAQMVTFPVGPGVSGHLLGGVLAAVLLGPWAGAAVIGAVLLVQCFLFGDGGLTALGANFVNMGLIGSVGGYAIYAPIRRAIGGRRGTVFGAMIAAWFSVLLASAAFAVELASSGRAGSFLPLLGWMALVHAGIGLGEAIITGLVLRSVLLVRPDLVDEGREEPGGRRALRPTGLAVAGLAVALAVAAFLSPLAFDRPDGLEYVGGKLGFLNEEAPAVVHGGWVLHDYELHLPGLSSPALLTAGAGLVGTLVVFVFGVVLARTFARVGPKLAEPSSDEV